MGWQELRETVKLSRNPERKMQDGVGVGVGQARAGATYQGPGEVSAGFAAEGRSGSEGPDLAKVSGLGPRRAPPTRSTAAPCPAGPRFLEVSSVWPGLPGLGGELGTLVFLLPLLALCSVPWLPWGLTREFPCWLALGRADTDRRLKGRMGAGGQDATALAPPDPRGVAKTWRPLAPVNGPLLHAMALFAGLSPLQPQDEKHPMGSHPQGPHHAL